MGIGSILTKIGKHLPFGIGDAVSGIADVVGGAAKSAGQANDNRDYARIAAERAKLDRDKFATTAPNARMQTMLRAALGKNAQPAQVHWGGKGSGLRGEVPTYTGGVKSIYGALKDPTMAGGLDTIMRDSLMAQQRGGLSGGSQDTNMGVADPSQMGKTSIMDKILGGTGLATGILGAILKSKKPPVTQPTPPVTPTPVSNPLGE